MEEFYLIVAYVMAGLIGLCVGSFLNVVIYRVPNGMSLAVPSSHCPKCKYVLRWYDNIPVLSYLILGGKCRSCKDKISFRYTAVELANTLLWLLSVALFWEKSIPFACIAAVASSVFICVFFIDLEHKLVFDRFVIILGVLGVAACFFDPSYGWLSHVIGGVAGFAVFYGIAFLFFKIKGKEGLGGGDIKLTAAAGLLLGWQRLLLAVLIATVSASVILLILTRRKKTAEGAEETLEEGAEEIENEAEAVFEGEAETIESEAPNGEEDEDEEGENEYPFAPFLTVGFTVALFFGAYLVSAYLSLLGL